MRLLYFWMYAFTSILLLLCIIKTKQRKAHVLRPTVLKILIMAFIAVFSYGLTFEVDARNIQSILESIYFGSMTWICYYLFQYAITLTNCKIPKRVVWHKILLVIVHGDMFAMLLNPWLSDAVNFHPRVITGETYLFFNGTPIYNLHLIFCYAMVLCAGVLLIHRLRTSKGAYRLQYIALLSGVAVVIIINQLFLQSKLQIDISLVLYGIMAILIYYISFFFLKPILTRNILGRIVHTTEDCIIAFDNSGEYLFSNDLSSFFGVNGHNEVSLMEFMELIPVLKAEELKDSYTKDLVYSNHQKRMYLRCSYHNLIDGGGYELGCYFHISDITEDTLRYQRQEYLAEHDEFTGLLNKNSFYTKGNKIMQSKDGSYYIVCSNFKEFKFFNERYGVEAGNIALKKMSQSIEKVCREEYLACRLESDHFAVLIPKEKFEETRLDELEQISFYYNNQKLSVHNRFGVYEIKKDDLEVSTICERALLAIEMNDSMGECYHYYDDALRQKIQEKQMMIDCFKDDLNQGKFQVYLQPQVNCKTGKVVGAEALVRWEQHDGTILTPGVFIPIFESCGLIHQLDYYIWEQVCIILSKWKQKGMTDIPLSVNVSGCDFEKMDLETTFLSLVQKYQIDVSMLRIEITETAFAKRREQLYFVENLRRHGFCVEMDDFGSGYSTLNMLQSVPVDIVKLDMGFVRSCAVSNDGITILQSIIKLIKELHMDTIAEGVETEKQMKMLRKMGNKVIQGYYYSKPITVSEFEKKYVVLQRDFQGV